MTTKLTLSLNQDVIERAKAYAKKNRVSLSLLVENYFRFITEKESKDPKAISPLVSELSGIIDLPDDFDLNDEYRKHVTRKYS